MNLLEVEAMVLGLAERLERLEAKIDRPAPAEMPGPGPEADRERTLAAQIARLIRVESFIRDVLADHRGSRECIGDACERCLEGRAILREFHGEDG